MLITQLFNDPIGFFASAIALIIGITVHEFSHALVASRLGDDTPQRQGRVTLNPLKHLDPLGTLFLIFAGFGWGRPVQFNPLNLKNPRMGSLLVGLAGPAANLLMVVIFGLILRMLALGELITPESGLFVFLSALLLMNLVLLVFNLIPIPPLDGSKAVLALLPRSAENFALWFQRTGPFLLLLLIILDTFLPVSILGFVFQRLITFTVNLVFA
jgi:Zn-dependent protease